MSADPLSLTFAALADPTRRAILARLSQGESSVKELAEPFAMSLPAVSKHLAALKLAGLVRDRPEGRQTHYRAQIGALAPLVDWTREMNRFWESRFDELEDLLRRMDQ